MRDSDAPLLCYVNATTLARGPSGDLWLTLGVQVPNQRDSMVERVVCVLSHAAAHALHAQLATGLTGDHPTGKPRGASKLDAWRTQILGWQADGLSLAAIGARCQASPNAVRAWLRAQHNGQLRP